MPYEEPEFLPWDGRRVPITFVGGYLGAGKTTAINQLLAATDRPIAVLVNDVGEINIDAALIERRHGDTIELTDGCVCCSLVDGFGAAFDEIRARPEPPDHVVVELSGAADPDRLRPWGRSAGFLLDGVVILVAADQLVGSEESGELPEPARRAVEQQVASADLLVLTKTASVRPDQADEARRVLRNRAPGTPLFVAPAPGGLDAVAMGAFLALGARRAGGPTDIAAPTLFDAHEVHRVDVGPAGPPNSLAHRIDRAIADVVGRARGEVVRAKGIVATDDGMRWLVQVVGRRREITPLPRSEWQGTTDLVVITL